MSVSISQVSFEHHRTALGIAETKPRISWRFEGDAEDWEQASYQVEIRQQGGGNKTSSYSGDTSDSVLVSWPGEELGSAEKALVRVKASGGGNGSSSVETPWSEWVSVETGLLTEEDWQGAEVIAAERETEKGQPKRPIYFRKDFSLDGEVDSARLYITGLGIYEAEINAERVGDHVLAPGWQSYHYRHVYDTYDITDLLEEGDNAIGVSVGEGWFMGRIGFESQNETWGDTIGALALVKVTLKDGTVVDVPTDTTWAANTGPVVDSQIYDGEIYDARLEKDLKGWSSARFDQSEWLDTKTLPALKGKLSSPDGPPVRKLKELEPVEIFTSPSGKQLIDFGQNLVGWLKITVEGEEGKNITLHHAEVLEDGELATRPLRQAKARDIITLHGDGPVTWEAHYTFHGFRYAQVDGWPEEQELTRDSVTAQAIWSDMEQTGHFECSHELLNKFHDNVIWSMRGNFVSIPTDCPQRDERLGWTGDAHAFGPTSNFLYDTAGFWRGWHRDVWSEMSRNDRMVVPFFVPTLPTDSNDPPAAFWADVAVANPWNLYRAFGDLGMLEEQFEQARAWIDKGVPRNEANLWDRSGHQFGDWLDPEAPPDDAGGATTHRYLVADAYLIEMTKVLANISAALGEDDLAEQYRSDHDSLVTEFQKAWVQDGKLANQTQTAHALALEFGLFTDDEEQSAAAENLRSIIRDNDYLVGTGFAGTPALGPALERIGAEEDMYAMLLQTQVPSWLYQVVQNATTTWERWDSLLEDGSVNPGEMTSFNHYAFGAVADWIHGVVGGLRPKASGEKGEDGAGWKVAEVKPVPGGGLTSAETRFVSGYGEVKVSWRVDEQAETFDLEVTVPPNTRAEVTLPEGQNTNSTSTTAATAMALKGSKAGTVKVVGSGVHRFSVEGYQMPRVRS